MSLHPALPPVLLTILALSILGVAGAAWYRWRSTGRDRKAMWRLAGLTLAALLLVVAAVRPVLGESTRTLPAGAADSEPNVFLLVDRSPTMDGARMDAVRDDVTAVVDRYPRARIALIAFASTSAVDWPLSQDTWALRPALAELRPYGATADTVDRANPAAASNTLRYQLISARQQFPRARNLVFYYGSGIAGADSPPRDFVLAENSVDGGAVFGYGRVGEPALRAVADQIGVPYVARTAAADADALDGADAPPGDAPPPTASAWATETYWIPALLAAVLILIEAFLVLRDIRRTRPTPLREST
ncbi:vWA domain-containing protein [Mycolicibacterium arenosum]|uniref:VWA domain-containing protein n=1 Tax=Mycolicibacterium arenosum TaxID=2952157 RepID=A0ABT1M864_9MYCO|nr:VWA domain-containing protein [Mycolicibacterium sp. CAU 1645]MCP9274725.1 VWA domain-containing protein [Mycolicibacterium sp. CAU 1645]